MGKCTSTLSSQSLGFGTRSHLLYPDCEVLGMFIDIIEHVNCDRLLVFVGNCCHYTMYRIYCHFLFGSTHSIIVTINFIYYQQRSNRVSGHTTI